MPERYWQIRQVQSDAECQRAIHTVVRHGEPEEVPACFDEYLFERPDRDGQARRRQHVNLSQTLVAESESELAAVVPVLVQSDGTMAFWKAGVDRSLVAGEESIDIRRQLYSAAADQFDASDCWIGQILLGAGDASESTVLSDCGFSRLTGLLLLELPLHGSRGLFGLEDASDQILKRRNLDRTPFVGEQCFERFATTIERTCEGTLDCPELNGHRNGQQALESHRLAGQHCPDLWSVFAIDGVDCGILLLGEQEESVREIVYFGVVPEFRRQGVGRAILEWCLQQARIARCESLTLAVDERNFSARSLYESLGFERVEQRIVHARLRPIESDQTSS